MKILLRTKNNNSFKLIYKLPELQQLEGMFHKDEVAQAKHFAELISNHNGDAAFSAQEIKQRFDAVLEEDGERRQCAFLSLVFHYILNNMKPYSKEYIKNVFTSANHISYSIKEESELKTKVMEQIKMTDSFPLFIDMQIYDKKGYTAVFVPDSQTPYEACLIMEGTTKQDIVDKKEISEELEAKIFAYFDKNNL